MPKIFENYSLKPFNTFGIDVKARYFCFIREARELSTVLQDERFKDYPKFILGGGSNILLMEDFLGLVLKIDIKGINKVKEDSEHVWITAGAGEKWHDLVVFCVNNDFAGVENLSLIPGTVGAAPIQNIGAYGVELKDVFEHLEAFNTETLTFETISGEECRFGYRNSIFKNEWKNRYIITSVTLQFNKKAKINTRYGSIRDTLSEMGVKDDEITIREVSKAIIKIRTDKLPDPQKIGNSGSFFKNPEIPEKKYKQLKKTFSTIPGYPVDDNRVKIPAGWLIEQCGWKGKTVGNTGTYENQALVLVNHGEATGKEIYMLSEKIIESVYNTFGIKLDREVNVIDNQIPFHKPGLN